MELDFEFYLAMGISGGGKIVTESYIVSLFVYRGNKFLIR